MHVTFIQPAIGRKADGSAYPATWRMQPLGIAMLSALTPSAVSRTFFDDRFDEIDFSAPTDLVAISAECYTAARAYQIAAEYRRRGVKVVVGGFHATLMPDEVAEHADAVCIGEAEAYWDDLLEDVSKGAIKRRYNATIPPNLTNSSPDRVIFGNRRYGPVGMVETSRGCRFSCEFCSITRFYKASYRFRPVEDVVREVASLRTKMFFFTDDNLAMDVERLKELCRAMIPLKIRWASQLSLHAAADEELLELLRRSGCMAVLVGFESLDAGTLSIMDKGVNRNVDYRAAVAAFRKHGIALYATFVFGYDEDDEETFRRAFAFAQESRFFFAAFNHLVPFPGTALYERLKVEGRLLYDRWWLEREVTFGQVVFRPKRLTPERLLELCTEYRRKFYALGSIARRGLDWRANVRTPFRFVWYWAGNIQQQREINRRMGLPCGNP